MADVKRRVIIQIDGNAKGLQQAIDNVDKELGQLVRQTDRAKAALGPGLGKATQQITKNTRQATQAVNQYSAAQREQLRQGRMMRGAYQNLGYQLQDTVVQLEMGTHWSRIFAQQGTQVLGAFGPVATVLGAVAAAAVIAAQSFGIFADEAEESTKQMDALRESIREFYDAQQSPAEVAARQKAAEAYVNLMLAERNLAKEIKAERFGEDVLANLRERVSEYQNVYDEAKAVVDLHKQGREFLEREADAIKDVLGSTIGLHEATEAAAAAEKQRREEAKAAREEAERVAKIFSDHIRNGIEGSISDMERFTDTIAAGAQQAWNLFTYLGNARAAGEAGMGLDPFGGGGDYRYDLPQTIKPPKVTKSKGGGGGSSDRDALMEYEKALELQAKTLRMTEEQSAVYEKLGDDVDKYTQAQIDGAIRATEALNRQKEAIAEQQELWDHVGSQMEEAFMAMIDGSKSAGDAMRDMARSIFSELIRVLLVQRLIGTFTPGGGGILGAIASADGNVFDKGRVTAFANGGVVNSPTLFPMSNGIGLMGEAGPEAIVPLKRDGTGQMGVGASPVVIHNYSGSNVSVEDRGDERHVIIGQAVAAARDDFSRSMTSGQGVWSRAMESGFNSKRRVK